MFPVDYYILRKKGDKKNQKSTKSASGNITGLSYTKAYFLKDVLIKRRGFLSLISCSTFGTVRRVLHSLNYQEFLVKIFFSFSDGEFSTSEEPLYKNQQSHMTLQQYSGTGIFLRLL